MEKKKCGGTLKEWRCRIEGEGNGEDKDVGGGLEEKGEIEESMIKKEREYLALFKLGDALSLLLTPTCNSGSLETFKLHL